MNINTQKSNAKDRQALIELFSEPFNGEPTARVDIHAGDGNLTIDSRTGCEQVLASGRLQYNEKQGVPTRSMTWIDGEAVFMLRGGSSKRPWLHLPWAACNGAAEWLVHLNPAVLIDLAAASDGGNLTLDLAEMTVSRVSTHTGGGNIEALLPNRTSDLRVTARTGAGNVNIELGRDMTGSSTVQAASGAGNVVVKIKAGMEAQIHAETGLGKVTVDPHFTSAGGKIYQSPGYESAADRVEIIVASGAGNVSVIAS